MHRLNGLGPRIRHQTGKPASVNNGFQQWRRRCLLSKYQECLAFSTLKTVASCCNIFRHAKILEVFWSDLASFSGTSLSCWGHSDINKILTYLYIYLTLLRAGKRRQNQVRTTRRWRYILADHEGHGGRASPRKPRKDHLPHPHHKSFMAPLHPARAQQHAYHFNVQF